MATFRLVMQSGPTKGTTYPLEKPEIFIGRDLGNDLVINDPEVSRRHVRIFLQGAGYVIEDQGSTNGTSVSGQKLMGPYTLRSGDLITFGEHINILVEAVQVDSDATMVSGQPYASETMLPPKAPQPAPYVAPQPVPAAPQYVPPPPPPPAMPYAGRVPMQPEEDEVKKKKIPTWLIIILIAIVLLVCICAVVAYFMPESWWCGLLGFLLNMFTPGVCPG